jgi:NAD-dependent SIR2 family protein deacetylase
MQHQSFMTSAVARRRYWSRSIAGWPRIRDAQPCAAHRVLASLEERGAVSGVVTQNVDRLHHRAGSRRVIELHGALAEVFCLECGTRERRDRTQERLLAANPRFVARVGAVAPDGDVELQTDEERFVVVDCELCGGPLKPDVVFFGGSVPRDRVEAGLALVEQSEALLVVGSSLAVFYGLRFVRRAAELDRPIAILNKGETRGDDLAILRIDADAGETLTAVARP